MRSDLELVPLSELALVNPRVSTKGISSDTAVSFIPMTDVSETGRWTNWQARKLGEVIQGYTAFQENDVLIAKITPCLENGKGAHVRELSNSIGFGSTEFHVLRAKPGNDSRFIFHWTRSSLLRKRAEAVMTGSAGQQRVSRHFFDQFLVP